MLGFHFLPTAKCMAAPVTLLVAGFLGVAPNVRAQSDFNPNTNPRVLLGLNQAQFMAFLQQAAAARAAVGAQTLSPTVNPGILNPYASANPYASGVTNPYNPVTEPAVSPSGQVNANPNSSYADSGSGLQGVADVMRAYATLVTNEEQARTLRERALQATLDTKKKKFDLDTYIKVNSPTYTEKQAKIAKMILKRIQTQSTEAEIVSGKALNILLDDMRGYPGKRLAVDPFALSEDVLRRLNVTKGFFSLERGEALTQRNLQKWAAGGKNLHELVDYMIGNGLKVAAATPGDEFAYRVVHSGMVALNVAVNTLVGSGLPREE